MKIKYEMKITAIHSGGDWYDASAHYLVVPESINIDEEHKKWRNWYLNIYCPSLGEIKVNYISFPEWLIKSGARLANENELIIYYED